METSVSQVKTSLKNRAYLKEGGISGPEEKCVGITVFT